MATVTGKIISLSNGIFSVKDENGNVKVLKVGDEIYENDTVFGDSHNSSSSKLEIQLSDNDVIVLSEGQQQLIDSSLIETAFGTEELFFTRDGIDLKAEGYNSNSDIQSDLRDAEFTDEENIIEEDIASNGDEDITDEETTEGEEEAEDETEVSAQFQARDGSATDVVSDLRDTTFIARTQTFEDVALFESDSEDRLSSSNDNDGSDLSNPTPNPTPTEPTRPTVPTEEPEEPEEVETPVIANLKVIDSSAYEEDGFLIFTVSLDKSVSTDVTFNYSTGAITASGNGVDYTDISGTATISRGTTSTTIKVPITDDYIADSGETINITISNVEGNANIEDAEATGTILDDPNNPDSAIVSISGDTTVSEGADANYTVEIDQAIESGQTVKVPVTYSYISAQTNDIVTNTVEVTLDENNQSVDFIISTIDDAYKEGDEIYSVTIGAPIDSGSFENVQLGNDTISTTIIDGIKDDIPEEDVDTTYVRIVNNDETIESDGNTLTHKLELVDKNGDEVTVPTGSSIKIKLVYTNDTTEDEDFTTKIVEIEIPSGSSSVDIINVISDDDIYEIEEGYTLSIAEVIDTDNSFEKLVIDSSNNLVTGTINDEDKTTPDDKLGDQPTLTINDATAIEGNNLVFEANLSNPTEVAETITLSADKSYRSSWRDYIKCRL